MRLVLVSDDNNHLYAINIGDMNYEVSITLIRFRFNEHHYS